MSSEFLKIRHATERGNYHGILRTKKMELHALEITDIKKF